MIQMRLILLLYFLLPATGLLAQEICDNGIDDDADGLIDLQDPECACNGIDIIVPASLFPNPSFEESTCPPDFGAATCAIGWVNPSQGTPDYYGQCNTQINAVLPIAACPIPDGVRHFGIADIFHNSSLHKEYVGTNLISPMEINEVYILSFWIGFVQEPDPDWSSPPVNFVVYGNSDANAMNVPFRGRDCPTKATVDTFGNPINPWEEIQTTLISPTNGVGWKQIQIEFTPGDSYASILLGPSCAMPNGMNYYFLDNLVLSKRNSFNTDFISVHSGQACNDDLRLQVPDLPDVTYQWYKDGVAQAGGTNQRFQVPPLPGGNGTYVCVISNAFGCTTSEGFVVDESDRVVDFNAPTGLCPGDEVQIGFNTNYVSYTWENGLGNDPTIDVTQAGNYSVTVVDNDGCRIEGTHELVEYQPVQYVTAITKESAPGAMDGEILINHELGVTNPGVLWWDGSQANPHDGLAEGIYCVTITADERCPVEDCIDLDQEIQPIVVDTQLTHVRCFGETNGEIAVQIGGGLPPFQLAWASHPEWQDEMNISDLPAGSYRVEIRDAEGSTQQISFLIEQPEELTVTIEGNSPTCAASEDGLVWISSISGGNGGNNYFWNNSATPGPDQLTGLRGGTYQLQVVDQLGCAAKDEIDIPAPLPIQTQVNIKPSDCYGADNGSIALTNTQGGTEPFTTYLNGTPTNGHMDGLVGGALYVVGIVDDNGCSWEQGAFVGNVKDFHVDLGSDQVVEEFTTAHVRAEANLPVASYEWSDSGEFYRLCSDCPTLEIEMDQSHMIVLEAMSDEGCIDVDSLMISMTPSKRVYIPNAFSPNNDGINDRLQFFNVGEVESVGHFRVYNRRGGKVFSIENVDLETAMKSWDESLDQQRLLPGPYVYTIEFAFKDGTLKRYNGDISILR